jgi:hypothetical protein
MHGFDGQNLRKRDHLEDPGVDEDGSSGSGLEGMD